MVAVCGTLDSAVAKMGGSPRADLSSAEWFSMSPSRAMIESSSPAIPGGASMPGLSSRHERKCPNPRAKPGWQPEMAYLPLRTVWACPDVPDESEAARLGRVVCRLLGADHHRHPGRRPAGISFEAFGLSAFSENPILCSDAAPPRGSGPLAPGTGERGQPLILLPTARRGRESGAFVSAQALWHSPARLRCPWR